MKIKTEPPIRHVCEAYGCSRQNLHLLRQRYNLTREDFGKPEKVFEILLEKSPSTALRRRLADPKFRKNIAKIYNH